MKQGRTTTKVSAQGLSEKDLPKAKVQALSPLQAADLSSEESLTYPLTWEALHSQRGGLRSE